MVDAVDSSAYGHWRAELLEHDSKKSMRTLGYGEQHCKYQCVACVFVGFVQHRFRSGKLVVLAGSVALVKAYEM